MRSGHGQFGLGKPNPNDQWTKGITKKLGCARESDVLPWRLLRLFSLMWSRFGFKEYEGARLMVLKPGSHSYLPNGD